MSHPTVRTNQIGTAFYLMDLIEVKKVVGVIGFEPTTTCSQSRYATRLRYTPTLNWKVIFNAFVLFCP
jgi:hypothetical protein